VIKTIEEVIRVCVMCGEPFVPDALLDELSEEDGEFAFSEYPEDQCDGGLTVCRATEDEVFDDFVAELARDLGVRFRRNGRVARRSLIVLWLRGMADRPYGPHGPHEFHTPTCCAR
jgi:hypothetical protein